MLSYSGAIIRKIQAQNKCFEKKDPQSIFFLVSCITDARRIPAANTFWMRSEAICIRNQHAVGTKVISDWRKQFRKDYGESSAGSGPEHTNACTGINNKNKAIRIAGFSNQ